MHAVIVIVNAFRALKSVARQSSLEMHAQSQCLLARSCAHNEINLPEGNDKARRRRVKAPTAVFPSRFFQIKRQICFYVGQPKSEPA